jgi:hypothetical protein
MKEATMSTIDTRSDNHSTAQDFTGKLQQAGKDVKERVSEAASAATDTAKQAGAAARKTVSHAGDKLQEQLSAKQNAGADYAQRFAHNIRGAAQAFSQDTPAAARAIEMAAGYVEDAATKMRNGSLQEMMNGMTSFARRQPAAFLGLSVLAGFAAVRFLKASASNAESDQSPNQGRGS